MPTPRTKRKPRPIPGTGLIYGQAAKIARIHRVSKQHVVESARGRRKPDEKLARTIEAYRQRNLEAGLPAAIA